MSLPNVALTGLARSGKDTVGRILAGYGYHRVSFADGVRQVALALDPIIDVGANGVVRRLSTFLDAYGYEQAKATPEVRRLYQRIGTEAGRDVFGPDVWVDIALKAVEAVADPLVFTDVRFGNEALAARKRGQLDGRGTILVRMVREIGNETLTNGTGNHPSETGVATMTVDHEVANDGTIGDLEAVVHTLITSYAPEVL